MSRTDTYDFSLQRCPRDTKPFRRRTDDGSRLQQDNPILACGVVAMNPDQMTWRFPSEDAHGGLRPSCTRRNQSNNPGNGVNRAWF